MNENDSLRREMEEMNKEKQEQQAKEEKVGYVWIIPFTAQLGICCPQVNLLLEACLFKNILMQPVQL